MLIALYPNPKCLYTLVIGTSAHYPHVPATDKMANSGLYFNGVFFTTRARDDRILYESRWSEADDQVRMIRNNMAELQIRIDRALIDQKMAQWRALRIQLNTLEHVEHMYSNYADRMIEKMFETYDLIRLEEEQQEQQDQEDRDFIAAQP